jgi:hypothetical protein
MIFINPTGQGLRNDRAGLGSWGAPRGTRKHKGIDLLCCPDQPIWSPIDGLIVREARPYASGQYSGVLIEGDGVEVKIFYFEPDRSLIGQRVAAGQAIGTAQDITERYPNQGMRPHIHLEIVGIDPLLFMGGRA